MVVAPRVSGSMAGTLLGGGGIALPKMRSLIHAPRTTGDVVVPLAVTLSTLACVSSRHADCWLAMTRVATLPLRRVLSRSVLQGVHSHR